MVYIPSSSRGGGSGGGGGGGGHLSSPSPRLSEAYCQSDTSVSVDVPDEVLFFLPVMSPRRLPLRLSLTSLPSSGFTTHPTGPRRVRDVHRQQRDHESKPVPRRLVAGWCTALPCPAYRERSIDELHFGIIQIQSL